MVLYRAGASLRSTLVRQRGCIFGDGTRSRRPAPGAAGHGAAVWTCSRRTQRVAHPGSRHSRLSWRGDRHDVARPASPETARTPLRFDADCRNRAEVAASDFGAHRGATTGPAVLRTADRAPPMLSGAGSVDCASRTRWI